jgi:hypothetical protein
MNLGELRKFMEDNKDLPDDTDMFAVWRNGGDYENEVSLDVRDNEEHPFDENLKWHMPKHGKVILIWHG